MNFCSHCGAVDMKRVLPLGDIGIRYTCFACGTVHYQNPNIVAGCVATWDDKVVLCRRAIEPFAGLWTIPAGYLESGETVEEAARREAHEEGGVSVGRLDLMSLYNLPMFGEVYLVYRGALVSPILSAGEESSEVGLFSPSDIPWDSLAFPMAREALAFWMQTLRDTSANVQTLDFFWGPEGAVRVRRHPNTMPNARGRE
jgi:ADP-ribose pyrophosphatase YjhB (NUDIX family)